MKKILRSGLFAALVIISSCRTETITCDPGTLHVNAIGFSEANVSGSRVTWYAANTNTAVDSTSIYPGSSAAHDTLMLFTMLPTYDYRLRLNDGTVYSFNNLKLSGIKQQTIKRGLLDGKDIGCIERIVSYDLNGTRYSTSGNQYDRIYIR